MALHPPRPVLTVRVGVSGHRWGEKLDPSHAVELVARIREALEAVEEIARRIGAKPANGYRMPESGAPAGTLPPLTLRLVSALAEGADRLLVEAAPAKGPWQLSAVLPFPVEVYQRDFKDSGSEGVLLQYLKRAREQAGVVILDGDRDSPNAFGPVGTAICLNSDVLIAVWNGLPGRPGGTAEVVETATRIGIPVVTISPDGKGEPWLHRPEARDHGASEGLQHLEERMWRLFLPPGPPEDADPEEQEHFERLDLRDEYFDESHRGWQRGQWYGFLIRLLAFSRATRRVWWKEVRAAGLPLPRRAPADPTETMRNRWRRKWKHELKLADECVDPIIDSTLADHHGWASHLAAYYAGRYRNAFLLGYMLSWVAVAFAASGLAVSALKLGVPRSTMIAAMGEVGVIVIVFFAIYFARRGKFHERWLAYRSLTEGFRALTFTLPFARASALDASGGYGGETWVEWMQRAVIREIGLPPLVMTHGHLIHARKLLLEDVLHEQIEYHRRTAANLSQVERRIASWTRMLFAVALVLSIIHLREAYLELSLHPEGIHLEAGSVLLEVIALIIPAAVASAHGFISQAEFEGTAARSRTARRALERLETASVKEGLPLTSEAMGGLAARIAETMNVERGAWLTAYQLKAVDWS